MAFRMPQKKIIQPNIQINGSNIEFVETFMFLGITINNKLNWNSHINKVTNKIFKTVGILNKLRSSYPLVYCKLFITTHTTTSDLWNTSLGPIHKCHT